MAILRYAHEGLLHKRYLFWGWTVPLTLNDSSDSQTGQSLSLTTLSRRWVKRKCADSIEEQGCEWKFNPPHASHFGGVWERQIGTIRRVLDAMLLKIGAFQLDDELLLTLTAEVSSTVNSRPITVVAADVDEPVPLSPSMLLTMKPKPFLPPPGVFARENLYARKRWRRVQYLVEQLWLR